MKVEDKEENKIDVSLVARQTTLRLTSGQKQRGLRYIEGTENETKRETGKRRLKT
jgi:hypothetical protein